MRERGKVITVREGSVDVLMQPSAGCGGCTLCSRNEGGETVMHDVADALGSTVGDVVDVVIPDAVRSRARSRSSWCQSSRFSRVTWRVPCLDRGQVSSGRPPVS